MNPYNQQQFLEIKNNIPKVYCAKPMNNQNIKKVKDYYKDLKNKLLESGIEIIIPPIDNIPMTRSKEVCKWLLSQSDILLMDIRESKTIPKISNVSIGCIIELAWSDIMGKLSIMVVDRKNSLYRHPFIEQSANMVFYNMDDAIKLINVLGTETKYNDRTTQNK